LEATGLNHKSQKQCSNLQSIILLKYLLYNLPETCVKNSNLLVKKSRKNKDLPDRRKYFGENNSENDESSEKSVIASKILLTI